MLTISPPAADAIREIVASAEMPDEAGLRISLAPSQDTQGPSIGLSVAPAPAEGDQVVEDDGAQVFVDGELAQALGDKRLVAAVEGEGVKFGLESEQ